MENKLKLKISRIFRFSLTSCHSKNISDVKDQPFFFPQNPHHHHQLIELFSPKPRPPRPFPSICRPKSQSKSDFGSGTQTTHLSPRTKVTDRTSLLPSPAHKKAQNCSPGSPILPLITSKIPKQSKSRKRRKKKNNSQLKNQKFEEFFASVAGNYYGWYSDSEDEAKDDDVTTFFSSKSLSSDSSGSFPRQGRVKTKVFTKGAVPLVGKVKDSFAVVKRSSDPYNDFRTSMVEMIVERQIFGSKDLENLLQCFLSLNSVSHHRVIVEVFTEIWETLFTDWL